MGTGIKKQVKTVIQNESRRIRITTYEGVKKGGSSM